MPVVLVLGGKTEKGLVHQDLFRSALEGVSIQAVAVVAYEEDRKRLRRRLRVSGLDEDQFHLLLAESEQQLCGLSANA